jgi:alpha-ketoglutaric semialdehyde dehydrogenase
MRSEADALAACVATETGKPPGDAAGEVGGAILQGEFFAGEGMRLYGRSLTSGMVGKQSTTIRQPHGVVGLIVPANTPIANIAWKIFPALICGNAVVLKASEDAPEIALRLAKLSKIAGLPDGVLNVIQGTGRPAGAALVEDSRVALISFTGSTAVGRWIAETAGRRLARVSLELGGKNPFVVCDDADIEKAVHWAALSAFSNAGQRCAAGSRILVFESVYERFKAALVEHAQGLRLGVDAQADLGPVISARQHQCILRSLELAKARGLNVVCGGEAPSDPSLTAGYYIKPTLVEVPDQVDPMELEELFGPVASLSRVSGLEEALARANSTPYGLTAAIHTRSIDRAMWFAQRVRAGVANINLGTYGSEPHMPFGGFGLSGNGTREPGVEALDVYSELKNISWLVRDDQL